MREARVIYLLTTDRQTVNYYSTIHALELIYFDSNTQEMINQRTSGPVNAHLTPGPSIYFNAFIYVYSPRAGADNPLGANVDVNRKPLSLCPLAASFKTISLILNTF